MMILRMTALVLLFAVSIHAQTPDFAIVEKIAGAVGFYTADGRRIGGVKVGAYPHEIEPSPDGRKLYVSDNGVLWMTDTGDGGNTISVIDVASQKKTGVIDLGTFRRPHGLAIHARSGKMLATIENPDGVVLIDPAAGKVIRKFDTRGAKPHMVIFSRDGAWAYAGNTGSATVAAIHLASGKTTLIPVERNPQGAVLTRDGRRMYVACSEGNAIVIIDTARHERIGTIPAGAGAARIALTPDERTLVYNLGAGNAVAFADVGSGDIASSKEIAVVPIGGRPLSLTLSRDGRTAYAGIQDQDKIVVLSVPERRIVREFRTPKGAGPDPVLPLR